MSEAVMIYVTASGPDEALALGRALVEARLAACANVLPSMTSLYWWDGAVQQGAEAVLLLKTRSSLAEAVVAELRARHSYDCPCVAVLPISGGNPAFLAWIAAETRSDQPGSQTVATA